MSSGSFKSGIYKLSVYKSYNMYKGDLAVNNLYRLICHKTQIAKTKLHQVVSP